MRYGFFYDFSNYGSYERLSDDGLTQWHPAFLRLGSSLEECAKKYKGFCQRYKPKKKNLTRCYWGSKLLAGVQPLGKVGNAHPTNSKNSTTNPKKSKSRFASSQSSVCQVSETPELSTRVVGQFISFLVSGVSFLVFMMSKFLHS